MAGDFIRDSGTQKWINVFGDVQIIENLTRLKNKLQRKVVKDAIKKGLVPIRNLAKQKAPKGKTGLLKKSIKSTVTKMVSGKVFVDPSVVMIEGQRIAWKKAKGMTKKQVTAARNKELEKARAAGYKIIQPAKYAHLVEFGTRKAKAKPFMRPALEQSRKKSLRIISDEVGKAIAELNVKK